MMQVEKTVIFHVDGKPVSVADLPAPVRKQVEIYDAYRQIQAEDAIKFDMSTMALNVKQLQLQEIIRQVLNPKAPEAETPAANE